MSSRTATRSRPSATSRPKLPPQRRRDYDVPDVFTDWREMLASDLDAVLILTSGSHAPIAVEAARSGRHVFTEKPMCFSTSEASGMIEAARNRPASY